MQIGAMTNPYRDLLPQIHWIGKNGFDYVDLAVEPPRATASDIDSRAVLEATASFNLGIVVHTSPYLPVASGHLATRHAAWAELAGAVSLADSLGSSLMTIHYVGAPAFYTGRDVVDIYAGLLSYLLQAAGDTQMRIALENSPSNQGEVLLFREIFRREPNARLLLDVGHTHMGTETNAAGSFLADPIVGQRLSHVHLSDNNGRDDLHLPLGATRNGIDWRKMISMLRNHPYDGRMTLEVFSPDLDYLLMSRDKLLKWWDEAS